MPKVLDVISSHSAVAILIAPARQVQPWCRRLLSMAVANPIKLPNSNRTIWRMGPIPEPLKTLAGLYMPGEFVERTFTKIRLV